MKRASYPSDVTDEEGMILQPLIPGAKAGDPERLMGLKPSFVLFDSCYTAQKILNWLSEAAWLFVTRLKKSRKLDGCPIKADRRPYWLKVGKLKLLSCAVVIRHGKRYFCSNDSKLDRKAIQRLYCFRQQIEEAFRSLKQDLGWTGTRFRTLQTLNAHLALTLAAHSVIETECIKLKLFRHGLISRKHFPPILFLHSFRTTA